MQKYTLITGASQGIGLELAKQFITGGENLILVSRNIDKLEKAKDELQSLNGDIDIRIYAYDLTEKDSPKKLFQDIKNDSLKVNILVNNAGFGGNGKFHKRDSKEINGMMDLNMSALVNLTHLFLPEMIKNKDGKILNVSSTAGFLPGPNMAVYYATKAFVNSFSQAISEEVIGKGITVTALCPGPVKTGFAERGGLEESFLFKFAVSPEGVAKKGYKATMKGKSLIISNLMLSIFFKILPLMPRNIVNKISGKIVE